jgi:hypothetical protein
VVLLEPDLGRAVGVSTASVTLAVDTRARDLASVDHVVHELDGVLAGVGPTAYLASTHVVSSGGAHLAVAAEWAVPEVADPASLLSALESVFFDAGLVVETTGRRRSAGPSELVEGAADALERHRSRVSGRLARFPGQTDIERRLTVAEVVSSSYVDEVTGLAGTEVAPDSEVDLTGFVRPTWSEGRCTLLVQQAATGLIPFEVREQHACCSEH